MFKALGIVLLLYTIHAFARGEVYAKHRAWGRTITRAESPNYFLTVIVIYFMLSMALIFIF